MNHIERVTTIILDLPTIRPHILAMATMCTQSVVLVFVHRSDGIRGMGEATTIGGLSYGEESPEGIKLAIDAYFAPLLIGLDADRPADAMARITSNIVGNRFAKCAVETALLDAAGQAANLSLSELLGGRRHDRFPVVWTLASGDTAFDIEEGEAMLSNRRHNIFKLKIGARTLLEDCNHVVAVARALEGRAEIRVDLNQRWTRSQAVDGIARLQDAGVALIEQPLAKDDIEGMKLLTRRFDCSIMADESLVGPSSAWQIAKNDAADAFAIKISQSGGLTPARAVAVIADAAHIALYGGTMLESGVGTAASAQLFSSFPRIEWGTELFGPLLLADDFLVEPLRYSNFMLEVPVGPGLGIALDDEKIQRFARSKWETTKIEV